MSPSAPVEKHQPNDGVILYCKVLTYDRCGYTVKWLYKGNKSVTTTSQHDCLAKAEFTAPLHQKSNYDELFQCDVTKQVDKCCCWFPVLMWENRYVWINLMHFYLKVTLLFLIKSLQVVNMRYFITICCFLSFHVVFNKRNREQFRKGKQDAIYWGSKSNTTRYWRDGMFSFFIIPLTLTVRIF